MANYDIGDALHRIELLLLASMRRNLKRHLHEEQDEGFRWSMWQAEQLTALGNWTRRNYRQYAPQFTKINQAAIGLLQQSAERAALVEEDLILRTGVQRAAGFFNAPEDKLSALTNAVRHDLSQAEYSILRQADDVYRRALFDAQMYLQTGSGTLDNAIDMAVQDFMQRGIRSVVYRNGHRVEASVYARMALRTANVRAVMTGDGAARDRFGVHTVIVSPSGIACEKCAPWMGQILVDDVYCSGSREEAAELGVPLLSEAVSSGLLHPQCNCAVHTFQPGISKLPEVTDADREQAVNRYRLTQQQRYNERQIRKWKYAEDAAPDPAAQQAAHAKVMAWQQTNKALCDAHPDELRRDYRREKIWDAPRNPVVPDVIEKTPDSPLTAGAERGKIELSRTGHLEYPQEALQRQGGIIRGSDGATGFEPLPQDIVVPKLRKLFDDWVPTLSEEELFSVVKYTKNVGYEGEDMQFFKRLNTLLRTNAKLSDRMEWHSDNISNAIKKFRLEHDILCYRATSVNYFKQFEVGESFCAGYFLSSSASKRGALNGDFLTIIRAPKGAKCAYIEKLSLYPKQREVLFDKSCRYKVIEKSESYMVIEVIVNE